MHTTLELFRFRFITTQEQFSGIGSSKDIDF